MTFTGETATGWQQANFATPVAVSANTTYIASYYAPNGRYTADEGFFANSGVANSPLTALQDGAEGGNGVYRYGAGGGFPASSYQATNYWVDLVFSPSAPTRRSRRSLTGSPCLEPLASQWVRRFPPPSVRRCRNRPLS